MKPKIEFDDKMLQKAIDGLDPKTFRNAVKAGMRKSANLIKSEAVRNYKSEYPGSNRHKAIHMKVYRTGMEAMVDLIFLKGDKEMKPWVLRFQDKGTAMRATKAGYDRGFMAASNFFSNAVAAKKSQAESELARNVDEAIVKKARKEGLV